MSVLQELARFLGFASEPDGLTVLQNYLEAQEAVTSLEAVYGEPTFSGQNEPTAVFPYKLYNGGDLYDTGQAKEFVIPDNGLADSDSPLTQFLEAHGIFGAENIGEIEGQTDTAELTESGDIEITY